MERDPAIEMKYIKTKNIYFWTEGGPNPHLGLSLHTTGPHTKAPCMCTYTQAQKLNLHLFVAVSLLHL